MLEAEGRALRRGSARVWWACGLTALTVALAAIGSGLLLWALYQSLAAALGAPAAGAVTGVLALAAAGACGWAALKIVH